MDKLFLYLDKHGRTVSKPANYWNYSTGEKLAFSTTEADLYGRVYVSGLVGEMPLGDALIKYPPRDDYIKKVGWIAKTGARVVPVSCNYKSKKICYRNESTGTHLDLDIALDAWPPKEPYIIEEEGLETKREFKVGDLVKYKGCYAGSKVIREIASVGKETITDKNGNVISVYHIELVAPVEDRTVCGQRSVFGNICMLSPNHKEGHYCLDRNIIKIDKDILTLCKNRDPEGRVCITRIGPSVKHTCIYGPKYPLIPEKEAAAKTNSLRQQNENLRTKIKLLERDLAAKSNLLSESTNKLISANENWQRKFDDKCRIITRLQIKNEELSKKAPSQTSKETQMNKMVMVEKSATTALDHLIADWDKFGMSPIDVVLVGMRLTGRHYDNRIPYVLIAGTIYSPGTVNCYDAIERLREADLLWYQGKETESINKVMEVVGPTIIRRGINITLSKKSKELKDYVKRTRKKTYPRILKAAAIMIIAVAWTGLSLVALHVITGTSILKATANSPNVITEDQNENPKTILVTDDLESGSF